MMNLLDELLAEKKALRSESEQHLDRTWSNALGKALESAVPIDAASDRRAQSSSDQQRCGKCGKYPGARQTGA